MKEILQKLVQLQQIDDRIKEISVLEVEIPKELKLLQNELEIKAKNLKDLETELKSLEKTQRDKEHQIEDNEIRLTKIKSQQYLVRTQKEYDAICEEIQRLTTVNATLEDEILNAMEKGETLTLKIKELKAKLEHDKAHFKKIEQEKQAYLSKLKEEKANLTEEYQTLIKEIPKDISGKYLMIAERREGKAIVPAVDGICQGCNIKLRLQLWAELRQNKKLIQCPFCNRILFYKSG